PELARLIRERPVVRCKTDAPRNRSKRVHEATNLPDRVSNGGGHMVSVRELIDNLGIVQIVKAAQACVTELQIIEDTSERSARSSGDGLRPLNRRGLGLNRLLPWAPSSHELRRDGDRQRRQPHRAGTGTRTCPTPPEKAKAGVRDRSEHYPRARQS